MNLTLTSEHFITFKILIQLACGKTGYDYQSVRRWTTLNKLGYGLAECDKVSCCWVNFCCYLLLAFSFTCSFLTLNLPSKFGVQIFIPIHRNLHWCLAVINMKEKTYQYLDSLGGMDYDVLRILVGLTVVLEIKYYQLNSCLRLKVLSSGAKRYRYSLQFSHDSWENGSLTIQWLCITFDATCLKPCGTHGLISPCW